MRILDPIPIIVLFLLTSGLLILIYEIGFRVGRRLRRRYPELEVGGATGGVTAGLLGLLAFMLAVTIGIAGNQFQRRMELVATEANAIGTAYLRTDFLQEPDRTALRDLLVEYVDVRLAIPRHQEIVYDLIARSEEIHNQMWAISQANANEHPEWETRGLLVDSINEVIDTHGLRLFFAQARIAPLLWISFYLIAGLSFWMLGILNSAVNRRNLISIILFAAVVAGVLVVIMDLDRAQQGTLRVVVAPLLDLQRQIGASGP
jgi:hypothetical protein